MTRALLMLGALVFSACPPGGDARPFGVEASKVTLPHGATQVVGFRVPRDDGGVAPLVTVTPQTFLRAEMQSFVVEDDAFAGGLFLISTFSTSPGAYVVMIGAERIDVTVSEVPAATNSLKTTRRSTLAQLDHSYRGVGQLAVLVDDGTVWRLGLDGGAERVEGLAGVRAITAGPNETLEVASLDGPVVDLRGTQAGTVTLHADGSAHDPYRTLQGVSAVRPHFFGGPSQSLLALAVLDDGTIGNGSEVTRTIRGAIDLVPGGETFLRADGIVYDLDRSDVFVPYAPVFAFAGLRAFEGSSFETFSGQTAEFRHHALWSTPDGVAWFMRSEQSPVPLVPPVGVQFVDVFARGRGAYALGDDQRLYDLTSGTPVLLPFEHVRSAAPRRDVGVFAEGIRAQAGLAVVVPLRVVRDGYDGALVLTPRGLPADITAEPLSIAAQATSSALTLTFSPGSVMRAQSLEFSLTGDGLSRTVFLPLELRPSPRRITVARDLALKTDGTVWRFTPAPAVQLEVLSTIVSITDNLALDANGAVYSFGDNSLGQLGRVTATPIDDVPALVPGLPPISAIAHNIGGLDLSLALDRDGKVWAFGARNAQSGSATPAVLTGLPPMVDLSGDGSPAGIDASGTVWLLLGGAQGKLNGTFGRLGLVLDGAPAGVTQNDSILPNGVLGRPNVLWYTGWVTLSEGRGVEAFGSAPVLADSEGSVYATKEGVVLKRDGTLWQVSADRNRVEPMPGLTSVALPR